MDWTQICLDYLELSLQVRAKTRVEMANDIAHMINNPLQQLTNTIFLAKRDKDNADRYLEQAEEDLMRLSQIVAGMLKRSFDPQQPRIEDFITASAASERMGGDLSSGTRDQRS